jgi:hypothetical protein
MTEQIIRKIEVDGNPSADPTKPDKFGTSFEEALDALPPAEDNPPPKDENASDAKPEVPSESQTDVEVEAGQKGDEEVQGQVDELADLPDLDLPDLGAADHSDPGESKTETTTPEPEARADDEDSKSELDEIRSNPHTPAKTKKSIDRLLGKISSLKKALSDKEAEVSTVKAEVEKTTKAPPISDAERQELIMLRRKHSLQNDDTIKSYDERAKSAEAVLLDVVKSVVKSDQAALIEQMGFEKFAKTPNAFREFMDILQDNDPAQAALVSSKYAELVGAKREKELKAKELTDSADQWWKQQEESFKQQQEQQQAAMQEIDRIRTEFYQNTVESDPNFKLVPTAGLAGDALAKAKAENAKRTQYHQELHRILNANTLDERKKVVYRAALARPLADRVRTLEAELKAKTEKLKKIEDARSARPAHSTGVTSPAASDQPEDFVSALTRLAGGRV